MMRVRWVGPVLVAVSLLVGCEESKPPATRGAPPPPPPKPATCEGGGGQLKDGEAGPFFPRMSGTYCLDPNGGDQAFGEKADHPIDRICDLFDGECEIYKGFNVRRVVQLRYVDGGGSAATIDIHLSKFASTDDAYAMFTKRTVGDGDPADDATPSVTKGGGAAALGLGNAYLWRGVYLAELTYNDETAAEPQIKAAGDKLLPPLVEAIGSKLPGDEKLPAAVAPLPDAKRLPMGRRLVQKDLFRIAGVGPGAFGYYRDGKKRWRFVSIVRDDEDQAKDVLKALRSHPGASKEDGIGDGAVRLSVGEGAPAEWIIARKGAALLGVGDEARVLRAGMTPDEHDGVTLPKEQKVEELKAALESKSKAP